MYFAFVTNRSLLLFILSCRVRERHFDRRELSVVILAEREATTHDDETSIPTLHGRDLPDEKGNMLPIKQVSIFG